MKIIILFIVSILLGLPVRGQNIVLEKDTIPIKGDANVDGVVNVADIVETVNYIKGNPSDKFNKAYADVNEDGTVNDEDIKTIGKIIFTHPTYKLVCLSPKLEMKDGRAFAKICFKLLHYVGGQWVECPDKTLLFSSENGACTPTSVKTDNDGIGQILYTTSDEADDETGDSITTISTVVIDQEAGFSVNIRQTTELPHELTAVLLITDSSEQNHSLVTDKKVSIIQNLKNDYSLEGSTIETYPVMSIQDDDAFDYQLPQSYSSSATSSTKPSSSYQKRGGFASLLFPVLKSLNLKHQGEMLGKLSCGVPSEGQRIGLTPLYGIEDTFDGHLNTCGDMIKALVEKEGWECICHSMTARYVRNSYLVEGLDSEFADSLLVDAIYSGTNGLAYTTTTCYDTVTKKNYKVKKDLSGWDECPIHYAKPYLAVSKAADSQIVINPTYSVKYQVKTWLDRCDEAGMPYTRCAVEWGSSHSSWHVLEDQKYTDVVFASTSSKTNKVPFMVCPTRNAITVTASENGITENTDSFNVYNKYDYIKLKSIIDDCVQSRSWSIFRGHAYEAKFYNGYSSCFSSLYGQDAADCGPLCYKDENYPIEWILPLNYVELMDMMGDNVNDYWNHPPARLGISTWDEWYPCPGTTLAMFYDLMEYAISKGVTFMKTQDVLDTFGNKLGIGVEVAAPFSNDARLDESDKINWFCKIGADNSYQVKVIR